MESMMIGGVPYSWNNGQWTASGSSIYNQPKPATQTPQQTAAPSLAQTVGAANTASPATSAWTPQQGASKSLLDTALQHYRSTGGQGYQDPSSGMWWTPEFDANNWNIEQGGAGFGGNPIAWNLSKSGNIVGEKGWKFNPDGSYNNEWTGEEGMNDWLMLAMALGAPYLAGTALSGAIAGGAGAGAGAGGATTGATGSSGLAGDVLSKAALDGTNIFGANSIPGALDISTLSAAAPGLASQQAVNGITSALTAGTAIPSTVAPPVTNMANGGMPNLGSAAGTAGGLGTALSQVLGGGGAGKGGIGLGDLMAGLYSGYAQNQSSKDMLGWLDRQMSDIDKLYAPGSPEHELMKQEMERKDAAAGRNSQYGPRAVELAGRITDIKARNKAQLASALQGNYRDMYAQDNSDLAGLMAALGRSNSGGGIQNMSSFIDGIFGALFD